MTDLIDTAYIAAALGADGSLWNDAMRKPWGTWGQEMSHTARNGSNRGNAERLISGGLPGVSAFSD